MTHELALKLAQTETPEQMADRIVELYETIEAETESKERWIESHSVQHQKIVRLLVGMRHVDEVRYALSIMFEHGPTRNDSDWKMWAHGYVESMIVGLDKALDAIKEDV